MTVAAETGADVAIIDCSEVTTLVLGVCRRLMHLRPNMQILLHTDGMDRGSITDAIREGVRAIVLRSHSTEHLQPALDALADRRPYWEGAIDDALLDELLEQGPRPHPASLSELERMILQFTAEGYPTKEVAAALSVSQETVANTRTRLRRKLGLRSVSDLVGYVPND